MKKQNKRPRKRRKKELNKDKKTMLTGGGTLEKLPSPEEQVQVLTGRLAQLEQQEAQIRLNYATNFVAIFTKICAEKMQESSSMTKDVLAKIAEESVTAAEVIRATAHEYTARLKDEATVDPKLEEAKSAVLAQINNLSKAGTDAGVIVEAN